MRPLGVVVDPPGFDDASGIIPPIEKMLIEALIAQVTVKALDEGILGGLARRDIVPLDLGVLDPFEDRMARELGPIVRDNHLWFSSCSGFNRLPSDSVMPPLLNLYLSKVASEMPCLRQKSAVRILPRVPDHQYDLFFAET